MSLVWQAMDLDLLLGSRASNESYSVFQNPGPEQDPCANPFVICLSMVKFFCVYDCFSVTEELFAENVQISWAVEISQTL
jgi:hypothetical protein